MSTLRRRPRQSRATWGFLSLRLVLPTRKRDTICATTHPASGGAARRVEAHLGEVATSAPQTMSARAGADDSMPERPRPPQSTAWHAPYQYGGDIEAASRMIASGDFGEQHKCIIRRPRIEFRLWQTRHAVRLLMPMAAHHRQYQRRLDGDVIAE